MNSALAGVTSAESVEPIPAGEWRDLVSRSQLGDLPGGAEGSEGEEIARMVDIFGDHVATYHARHFGVVIGHSTEPLARTGSRILHLGILATDDDTHLLMREDGATPVLH